MPLELIAVNKSFGAKRVVDNLTLTVPKGEVFGFLGPNGAGKTTTMRMILDIIRPDSGQIMWAGKNVSLATARVFGYLPEERGLYPKMVVADQLRFFARLRGLSVTAAARQIDYWTERFQLGELVRKKANELSKGNQQKVQFMLAILHDPELLILDEPFSGLDPVNVELLKAAFHDIAAAGKTILFSSHRMEHVEELCSSLCILDKGAVVAHGPVDTVKAMTGRQIVRLSTTGSLDFLDEFPLDVSRARSGKNGHRTLPPHAVQEIEFDLPAGIDPQDILRAAMAQGSVKRFEIGAPALNEVFITLVGGHNQ